MFLPANHVNSTFSLFWCFHAEGKMSNLIIRRNTTTPWKAAHRHHQLVLCSWDLPLCLWDSGYFWNRCIIVPGQRVGALTYLLKALEKYVCIVWRMHSLSVLAKSGLKPVSPGRACYWEVLARLQATRRQCRPPSCRPSWLLCFWQN